jgi:hypothetical protein
VNKCFVALASVAAALTVENAADRLGHAGADGGELGHSLRAAGSGRRSQRRHIERLGEDIFDGQRFAVGLQAFEVEGDGFADVGDGFVEGVAFGMTAGQRGAGRVISACAQGAAVG